ncbi:QueT transporter family protein [Vallitalea sp.]|jgi:uncharacterized membrane protein|uniref:QueT transporter family protein n=1 Tax=Vallitalea sp. TaxID=1882829 RepID=UPI0025F7A64F|nr:QueT transporter family protein [Vallitalea sp.]MCT4688036.1 QueT transporter family protein [Vallitalea sp.]
MNRSTKFLTKAGLIAAIYIVLTLAFRPISFGEVQVRIAEALTILPFFTPAAIPGLFIGCLLGNFLGGAILYDIIFGSLASLISSVLVYMLRRYKYLVPIPPIVINGIVVGLILKYAYAVPLPLISLMVFVAIGQTIACYGLGLPLLFFIQKNNIFKND